MTGEFLENSGRAGARLAPLAQWTWVAMGACGLAWCTWAADGPVNEPAAPSPAPGLWRHEDWMAGLHNRKLEVRDPAAVFGMVFAQLPEEVQVWPTENYYYWQMAAGGRSLQGNLRLSVEGRARGELAFGYGEPTEFLDDEERADRVAGARTFGAADGVAVRGEDEFTYVVTYRGKSVVFHLNRLVQDGPPGSRLAPGDRFLQRTQDESGLRFYLLYNTSARYFFWVLDDTEPVPEHFRPLAPNVVIGRRTGFVFWRQEAVGGREVLASVRGVSLKRNDYHDGPFDQLADNSVRGDGLRPYLEEAMPWLRGRVDPWGNIRGEPPPRRVALTVHGTHDSPAEAVALIAAAQSLTDPVAHLSRGGRPATADPSGTATQEPR